MARRKKAFPTVTAPSREDGAIAVDTSTGFSGYFQSVLLNPEFNFQNEIDLIREYRSIFEYPDVNDAVTQICDEAVVPSDQEQIVDINFDEDCPLSKKVKDRIQEEFEEIYNLLEFDSNGYQIFQRWYVDGRIFYQILFDENNRKLGIQDLNFINPTQIKKITEVKKIKREDGTEVFETGEEYFAVTPKDKETKNGVSQSSGNSTQMIKLHADRVAYCHSGIIHLDTGFVYSHLHKAIRPTNLLRLQETALVIYRLARAPERRVFYIDVGNLPAARAEQHVNKIMSRYQNRVSFDAETGTIRGDKKYLSMLEDFWMPRGEGGKSTEITTLPGGQNLGQIEDIEYFQQKLFRSLNVPVSRLRPSEAQTFFGKSGQITRDELTFSKFIVRLQKKFSDLFFSLLRVQLLSKGILTEDEWEEHRREIQFLFNVDSFYEETKTQELIQAQLALLRDAQEYDGTYLTDDFILRKIMNYTDEEIATLKKYREKKKKEGTMPGGEEEGGFGQPQQPQPFNREPQEPRQPQPPPKEEENDE